MAKILTLINLKIDNLYFSKFLRKSQIEIYNIYCDNYFNKKYDKFVDGWFNFVTNEEWVKV